jgi:hypothetical protein
VSSSLPALRCVDLPPDGATSSNPVWDFQIWLPGMGNYRTFLAGANIEDGASLDILFNLFPAA